MLLVLRARSAHLGASLLIKKDLLGLCGVSTQSSFSHFMPQQLLLVSKHLIHLIAEIQEPALHLAQ